MYYFKLTGIFQNWCQSLLWIDYILSYSEVDSFPFFTKNAVTMSKIRYLWCTCSIARIQTSIWVTEVTGSTENIILCFQWKRIILSVWKNFISFTTERKFDFRNKKYKYVEYKTGLKSRNLTCWIILSNNIYLLCQRCCGVGWFWHTSERMYTIYRWSHGRDNCLLHAVRSCVSCKSCGQSCSYVDMPCYVDYEAIRLPRTSIPFPMQNFQALHIFWLFINHHS